MEFHVTEKYIAAVLLALRGEHHGSKEMLFVELPHHTEHDTGMVGRSQQPESQVDGV
jgi:hypothetical protein